MVSADCRCIATSPLLGLPTQAGVHAVDSIICFDSQVVSRCRVFRRCCARELAYVHARSTRAGPSRARLHARHRLAAAPLLWIILIGFALLAANGVLPLQRDRADLVSGHDPADVLLHADGCLAPGARACPGHRPFLVFGFAHLATSWKRPNRAAIRYGLVLLARRSGHPGLGAGPGAARRLRGPRPADPRRRLLAARGRAAGGGRRFTSSTAWPARGSAGTGPGGSAMPVVGVRRRDGAAALAGPAVVRRQGAEGRESSTSFPPRPSPPTASSSRPRR